MSKKAEKSQNRDDCSNHFPRRQLLIMDPVPRR